MNKEHIVLWSRIIEGEELHKCLTILNAGLINQLTKEQIVHALGDQIGWPSAACALYDGLLDILIPPSGSDAIPF